MEADLHPLAPTWAAVCRALAIAPPAADAAWAELAARYERRAYHNLAHVARLLADLHAPADQYAAFLHDLYVSSDPDVAGDAEELSAAYARALCPAADAAVALILSTSPRFAGPWSAAQLAFNRLDAAVLSDPPAAYDEYAVAVRAEYQAKFGPAAYAAGRRQFLQALVDGTSPYLRYVPAPLTARANAARELATLGAA